METTDPIFFEVQTGKIVHLPIFHTILTGITQHGKTEVIKALIKYINSQGFTVLVIDVKDKTIGNPDFAGFPQIPIYLKEVTEPMPLLGLLESDSKMQLRFQFPELIKACQKAKGLKDIRDRLVEVIEGGKVHPVRKDKAEVLRLLLDRLIEEISRVPLSSKPELKIGEVNAMTLANRGFSDSFKQLVVRTMIQYVRLNLSKVVVVFDEAHIQIPEGYSSASKDWIVKTIKEGASSKQYLIIADQTLKEVDKDVVTQCPLKIFGGQSGGALEAKRTLEYMPVKEGISVSDIMQLPLGHFYVCTREWSRLCYALPTGVPEEMGIKVARGELKPEYVRDHFMVKKELEGEESMWKEKYKELENKHAELLNKVEEIRDRAIKEGQASISKEVLEDNKALTNKVKELETEREKMKKELAKNDEIIEHLQHTDEEIKALEEYKVAFTRLFGTYEHKVEPAKQPSAGKPIDLEHVETPISVSHVVQPVKLTTESNEGKVLYAILSLDQLAGQPDSYTEMEIGKEMQEFGWSFGREIRFVLGDQVKAGNLVISSEKPVKYRLPRYRKIEVEKHA